MIDYVKAYFVDKETILEHISSSYTMNCNNYSRFCTRQQREINYTSYFKDFFNLNIKINNKRGFIQNSLHVLYNCLNGANINRNDNDFSYSNLLSSLDYVENLLDYPLDEVELSRGLEFGFNIEVPFDVDEFVTNDCIFYDYRTHKSTQSDDERTIKVFTKGYYDFKIYNKGKQFQSPGFLLRVELKFNDKRGFNNLGIYTLNDLRDKENLRKIFDLMHTEFETHMIIVDNIDRREFSDYKKKKLYRYTAFKFWNELSADKLKEEKKKFMKLLQKNNLLNNKKFVLDGMKSKFSELIDK